MAHPTPVPGRAPPHVPLGGEGEQEGDARCRAVLLRGWVLQSGTAAAASGDVTNKLRSHLSTHVR